jgi:hypothetical protein
MLACILVAMNHQDINTDGQIVAGPGLCMHVSHFRHSSTGIELHAAGRGHELNKHCTHF